VPRALSFAAFLDDARERTGLDAAAFARLLWHGGIQLDGRPLLEEAAPRAVAGGTRVAAWAFEREPEPIAIGEEALLLDRAGVVAVAKPAWLTMQGSRASQRLSLEACLRALLGRPSLVAAHRLDRQTTGVALFADGAEAARHLCAELAPGCARKRYLAVVAPPPREERFEVSGALARAPHPSRIRFALAADGEGRPSHTRFRCLERRGGRARVLALPETGRTHQIRVHLAAAGSPIAGDDLYGPAGPASSAERVLLHAASLALRLPGDGVATRIEAPEPADLAGALEPAAPPAG
jgi:RluA family pseudouridine synthase